MSKIFNIHKNKNTELTKTIISFIAFNENILIDINNPKILENPTINKFKKKIETSVKEAQKILGSLN